MERALRGILKFGRDTMGFISFLCNLTFYKSFTNPIKKKYNGTAAVLANGPSLKNVIPHLTSDEFKNIDFIVLNFFAFDDVFFKIKPKHYCFADPMFFKKSNRFDEVKRLFDILQNKIDWNLNIYVPKHFYKDFRIFSGINNQMISITKVNCVDYNGFEPFRNFFYKKGLSTPAIKTVAIMSIYVGLNCGYSVIKLYGVDHNYFESLTVNAKNQACIRNTHFYDKESVTLTPIRKDNGEIVKISQHLDSLAIIFKSHDQLSSYAKYLKKKIINCTTESLIDSYVRE